MKNRLLPFAVTVIMIFSTIDTLAQGPSPLDPGGARSKIFLGPVAGYNSINHNADNFSDFCPRQNLSRF